MRRFIGAIKDGRYQTAEELAVRSLEPVSANVIDDTMDPLKHPVTGETFNSKSAYRSVNRLLGLQEVGNDLLSKEKQVLRESVTDQAVMNAIEKAEAIHGDPTKLRAHREMNERIYEKYQKLVHGA